MAEGFDVELDGEAQVRFLDDCIICGSSTANSPKQDIEINPLNQATRIDMLRVLAREIQPSIRMPIHKNCHNKIRRPFLIRNIIVLVFVISAGVSAINVRFAFTWNNLWLFLLLIGAASMILFWQVNNPLPIEYEYSQGKKVFTFSSKNYAERFAQLNNAEVKKRV